MKKLIIVQLLFLVCALAFGTSLHADTARSRVKKGNEAFKNKKFDEALNKYQDALLKNPESPLIHFNVGDALYKKKNYKEALKSYQKALNSKDIHVQEQAYYNLGNCLYKLGKLPESILSYKEALKLDPNDRDAKYNLEYVRRKLKENAKKKPQNRRQNQQQQKQQQQQQQKQNNQKNQNQQKKQQQQQKQQQQKQGQQKQQQKQQAQKQKKNEMSKKDAERILNALKNDEKKLQKKRQMHARGGRARVAKDW
ncbi:MAG: tetratricopeptide repeat protein [Calditrichaeota bacterium]|nr:tetratricopeptide repeat protein [Calditrichota bacterium]